MMRLVKVKGVKRPLLLSEEQIALLADKPRETGEAAEAPVRKAAKKS